MPILQEWKARAVKAINKQKLNLEKRSLENKLGQLVTIMNGHKEASLPTGHTYYKMLWDNAKNSIADFRNKSQQLTGSSPTWDEILLGVPALREMEALAVGVQSKSTVATGATNGILIASILALASSVFVAIWHDVYVLLTHFVDARLLSH